VSRQRHAEAKVHFLAARALVGGERVEYLAELEAQDGELAREVASLLSYADEEPVAASGGGPPTGGVPSGDTMVEEELATELAGPGRVRPGRVRRAGVADPGQVKSAGAEESAGGAAAPDGGRPRLRSGSLFAGRYRIEAELGRGGMGHVYRAHDVLLDQPVALKLVAEQRAPLRERMVEEVRLARRVTHPNVCRVFDFGVAEGETFLTMEYVDGEDLRSLLDRIGRLPPEKFLELAQQLCAGLAAAHTVGVLHRDLKPANVMVDARGAARITDFGLATVGTGVDRAGLGTPGYAAPEQWLEGEASFASDLWSLGLVLHEMATGERVAVPGAEGDLVAGLSGGPSLSPRLAELDPRIAAVIRHCLAREPGERPRSAAAVAAALPGGDRLQRALEAGETPSPELVAAARGRGMLHRDLVWSLAALGSALLAIVAVADRAAPGRAAWSETPPALLVARAGELAERFGHPEPPVDRAWGFQVDSLSGNVDGLAFWYRQATDWMRPVDLELQGVAMRVEYYDPPPIEPGMILMLLGADGRLSGFKAPPADFGGDTRLPADLGPPVDPDWQGVLDAAGFTAEAVAVPPEIVPPFFADQRRAWLQPATGPHPVALRLEVATLGRQVVFADVRAAEEEAQVPAIRFGAWHEPIYAWDTVLWMLSALAALVLARRNLRAGRSDLVGARRLAFAVLACELARWLLGSDHLPDPDDEVLRLGLAVGQALGSAGLAWVAYVALEPLSRRYWPHGLIAWSRLLRGRARDPEVGRNLLLGAVGGAGLAALALLDRGLARALGLALEPDWAVPLQLELALSARRFLASALESGIDAAFWAVLGAFLLALLRRWVGRPVPATALWVLAIATYQLTTGANPALSWLTVGLGGAALSALVLVRVGLLAYATCLAAHSLLLYAPVTARFDAWYAEAGWFALGAVVALAVWGATMAVRAAPATGPESARGASAR
jgi:hypothetical protein